MKALTNLFFLSCLYILICAIGFLGLKLDLQGSNFLLFLGITFFIQILVPPFALKPLLYLLKYYKSRDFWKEYISPAETEEESKNIDYKDFEYLDKLISLSRNILLIIATLSAIIISLSSDGLKKWFYGREVKVMGFIDTNCDNKWKLNPNIENAFIIVHYRTTIKDSFEGNNQGDKMKELLLVENGQFEKTINIPKAVKYLKLELVMKDSFYICSDKTNKVKGFVHAIDENYIYRDFGISLKSGTQRLGSTKERQL